MQSDVILFLQCFDTVGWVIWPVKLVPDMTYNVFGGTLSLTQLQLMWLSCLSSKCVNTYSILSIKNPPQKFPVGMSPQRLPPVIFSWKIPSLKNSPKHNPWTFLREILLLDNYP